MSLSLALCGYSPRHFGISADDADLVLDLVDLLAQCTFVNELVASTFFVLNNANKQMLITNAHRVSLLEVRRYS
jgi:hypothetical protein